MSTSETLPHSIQKIEGGWRIKRSHDGQYYIDVFSMMFNFRTALTSVEYPLTYVAHWCYVGKTERDFVRTVLAALAWDTEHDDEPAGWNKNGQTGEWREPEKN